MTGNVPDGTRDRDRLRRARLTSLSSFAVHATTIVTGLVSVPLTVGYLGPELYGVWLTIGSLLMWLAVADLGFGGNALINALAEAHGRDDRALAQELVATAFWLLAGIAVLIAVAFLLLLPFVSWHGLFNVSPAVPASDLRLGAAMAMLGFVATFPLGVVTGIYHGYQEGYLSNVWSAVGGIAGLLALIAVTDHQGGLPLLVAALWGARALVSLASAVYIFGFHRPWLRPVPALATRRGISRLAGLGSRYLVAQFAGIGMTQSQPIIIAQVLGAAEVGVFNVAYRLLTLPLIVIQALVQPLMPAYGEARARGDREWILRTFRRSLVLSALATALMVVPMAIGAERLALWWVGPTLVPPRGLVIGLSVYVLAVGCVTPASVLLYGLERVGKQAIIGVLNAVAAIALGIWFTHLWGLPGMGAALAVAFLLTNPIGQIHQLRVALRPA
jgi:O-antigen/teichoic acid export membrane protein